MNELLKKENEAIELILEAIKQHSLEFLNNIDHLPTGNANSEASAHRLPEKGEGTFSALDIFKSDFQHLITASAGPRYWGFVTGGATPAALAGDWLTSVFDQNTQSIVGNGDLSAIIEIETIKLMLQLFGLPQSYNGGFVTGATMSNFTCLAVARQWAGKLMSADIAREGMIKDLIVLSAVPHSSVIKSLSMLGFGSNNFIKLKTLPNREAVDIADLRLKLEEHKNRPIIVCCSGGTVNSVDFDDFELIALLKNEYNFWMHIDAAFGGFAACAPSHQHLLNGWESADSITVDCHKWMNVPYDSAVFFVKKEHSHLQVETFQNSNAPYLGNPEENFSYLNFLPENSRRFRALPAWFSLIAYGKDGFRSIVENNIKNAADFGEWIHQSSDFELLTPVILNTVCFTLSDGNRAINTFLSTLNKRGKVFMTPSVLMGKSCIRAAFVNWRTTEKDLQIAQDELITTLKIMQTVD